MTSVRNLPSLAVPKTIRPLGVHLTNCVITCRMFSVRSHELSISHLCNHDRVSQAFVSLSLVMMSGASSAVVCIVMSSTKAQYSSLVVPLFCISSSHSVRATRRARAKATSASHAPCSTPSHCDWATAFLCAGPGCRLRLRSSRHRLAKIVPNIGNHRQTPSTASLRLAPQTRS